MLVQLYPDSERLRFYLHAIEEVGDGPISNGRTALPSFSEEPPLLDSGAQGVIDKVWLRSMRMTARPLRYGENVGNGDVLELTGWAPDPQGFFPAGQLLVLIDGRPESEGVRIDYGIPRPDVALKAGKDSALQTGFSITVRLSRSRPGPHLLAVGAVRWDRFGYRQVGSTMKYVVSGPSGSPSAGSIGVL